MQASSPAAAITAPASAETQHLLAPHASAAPITLRGLQAGDLGWVVSRHGALYQAEYGFDMRFEALVARIAADYVDRLQPARESAWVAERGGQALGCVFLVQARDDSTGQVLTDVAQLRLLLVEPPARGQGLGKTLVQQCHHFARQAGYHTVRLWTQTLLRAARGIYQHAGYRLASSEAHHSFGHELVGEMWELDLRAPAPHAPAAR